ncbi:serine/threonine-protein kinase [Actinacidiphila bryophytorum]|uniref:non-specific serine/threonine protein kinase n=1 Tax=Actinacidiphila bryophytorum TaxID=1436133 RepID=A0A9W4E1P9_9ACTN|nr:serine/threonine-protein kinase [Actinacidiphila bryophytorum]MBM9436552.1 protein kinase [Actinacidiphila bryophytorum]MBN6546028.1 protein kinase [Actinacidiphila bryophytorum]CAG7600176.1 Non-specific serine/threonine protein kinase [Actinacidiphila bryophytorum]
MSEDEGTDGRVLAGRYRLDGVLGKGGMGTVWRAVDETLGRTVAVKELRFNGNVDEDEKRRMITRTLREAKATARIRNTGAITVYDVVEEDDRPWIVMELIEGRSLAEAIREDGPLTPRRAAEVGLVVLQVLSAAHREGILHRDVKPSNVLIADDSRVVLGDFGIAQIDGDPSVTSTGMLVGAPSYISPERARGQKPGPPADLWSLGALLFAAVEGRPPYDKGSAIATLTAVMTEPVGPMPHAGPLAATITGLLAKDPEQRIGEAAARALLTAVANAPEQPALPPAPSGETRTAVLPVDPQPPAGPVTAEPAAPADAPPAAEQVRVREALRSVRKAAAKTRTAPAPEPGVAPDAPPPARSSITDVLPRRTLVLVVAAVVLALLGTVIGVALANSGGGNGDGKPSGTTPSSGTKKTGSTPSSASPSTTTAAGSGGEQGDDDAGDKGKGGDNGKGGGKGKDDALTPGVAPAGYTLVQGAGKASVAIPAAWKAVPAGQNHYHSGTLFRGPGGAELLVDFTPTPGPSALAKWQHDSQTVGPTMPGYHLIGVKAVDYRGYDTADWEYKRTVSGTQMRVQNRGMVTDAHHGYALLITFPADAWNSEDNRRIRDVVTGTFKPAE